MTPSTPSSLRLVLANTSQDAFSSTWSQPSLTKFVLVPTDNSSTQSNSSPEKKTLPTTLHVVTTPLVRKSLTSASTVSESWPINALVSKDSSSTTLLVVVLAQVSVLSSLKDSQLTTARNLSSASLCTHLPRCPQPSLSHTILSSQLILSLSTLMSPSCSTTRPSMISAAEI